MNISSRPACLRACRLALALVVQAVAMPPIAWAQTAAVQEIIVTARKREESLQDIPLSISALSGEQLQQLGAGSDYDVANFTVNFSTVQQTGRDFDRPVIRGQAAPAVGGEPNASYFVDGVFVTSSISTATLDVIDRVEVLRGPQSALLGRGTFSGAVNYVTKKPTNEFQAVANARVGSHEDYKAGAWASGPIIGDKLLFLLSGSFESYGGQWRNTLQPGEARFEPYSLVGPLGATPQIVSIRYNSIFPNAPQQGDNSRIGNEQTTDFLAKLLAKPFDGTEVTLKYGYTRGDDGAYPSLPTKTLNCYLPTSPSQPWYATQLDGTSQAAGMYCGELKPQGLVNKINIPDFLYGVPAADPATGANVPGAFSAPVKPGTRRTTQRYLLDLSQAIADFQIVARASYDTDEREIVFDLDHTADRVLGGLFEMDAKSRAHDNAYELRVSSPGDRRVRGQVGLYYFNFRSREIQRALPGPGVPIPLVLGEIPPPDPGANFGPPLRRETVNEAVFGSLDWDFADRWTLALEARYGSDRKDITPAFSGSPPTFSIKTSSFTPRITLRVKPTDDAMVYVLAARGNKPADFNDGYLRSNNDASVLDPHNPQGVLNTFISGTCAQPALYVCEETAWTYEFGAKTKWLDGRVVVNADIFYIDWRNLGVYQIGSAPGSSGSVNHFSIQVNDGSARSYGLELESNYAITDNFSVRASYGYTHAKFLSAVDAEYGRITGQVVDQYGNGDVSGNWVPNTPQHTFILGASVTRPLQSGREIFLRLDDSYTTRRYTQAGNFNWTGDRNLVNVHFGLQATHWTATGYVKNLLNDITQQADLNFVDFGNPFPRDASGHALPTLPNGIAAYSPASFWSLNPTRGRDIGVTLQYRF